MGEPARAASSARPTPPPARANGHVMMGESEAHTRLLQDPPADEDDDEIVVSVQVNRQRILFRILSTVAVN